jgi:hypothetical protein
VLLSRVAELLVLSFMNSRFAIIAVQDSMNQMDMVLN